MQMVLEKQKESIIKSDEGWSETKAEDRDERME